MSRPYLNLRIDQLQDMGVSSDPTLLQHILDELSCRQSSASKELYRSIEKRLNSLNVNLPPQSCNDSPDRSGRTNRTQPSKNDGVTAKVISSARQKLLDLTRRNRLIHFAPGDPESGRSTADSLVLMGNAAEVWNRMVVNEDSRDILVLTESEQTEAMGGIDPSTREPEIVGHTVSTRMRMSSDKGNKSALNSKRLQDYIAKGGLVSPLPLKKNTAKLQSIFRKQQTLESSIGDSCLFLAIGFLEWEVEDATSWRKGTSSSNLDQPGRTRVCSPLLLLHVKLERFTPAGGGDLRFRLEMDADEPQGNPCLLQKFQTDLNIALPKYDPEQHQTWTEYITALTKTIARKTGNKIHPTICLGFFNFAKYRMWLDLNPEAWPDSENLYEHPIISALAERRPYYATDKSSSIPSSEEVAIHQTQEDLPIILRADSSQYAALLATRENKSITIVGPPGTGKSQTISNLIATALHDGKRVLFVAQKMPALDVVYDRLTEEGIGNLCLPLYTSKSRPVEVHEHLGKASQARRSTRNTTESNRSLTAAASRLNDVADALADVGAYGTTAKIIANANAKREQAQAIIGRDFSPEIIDINIPEDKNTYEKWEINAEHALREWTYLLDAAGENWIGWLPEDLVASNIPHVMRSLRLWSDTIQNLDQTLRYIDPQLCEISFDELAETAAILSTLPHVLQPSAWLVSGIANAGGELHQIAALEALISQYNELIETGSKTIPLANELPSDLVARVSPAVQLLSSAIEPKTRLVEVHGILDQIHEVHLALASLRTIATEQPDGVTALGGMKWGVLRALTEFPHDAVPTVPRQLNQRVATHILNDDRALAELPELERLLANLQNHQVSLSSCRIGLGNLDLNNQDELTSALESIIHNLESEPISANAELLLEIEAVADRWRSAEHNIQLIAHHLKEATAVSIFNLSRTPHLSLALSLTNIDRQTVESVEQGLIDINQLKTLRALLNELESTKGRYNKIQSRISEVSKRNKSHIESISNELSSESQWNNVNLSDLRNEIKSINHIESGRCTAVAAANELRTAWGEAEAKTQSDVENTFSIIEYLRSFPSLSVPPTIGRWPELPIQREIDDLSLVAQEITKEREALSATFLIAETPSQNVISKIRQTFSRHRGPFRFLSSEWRSARSKLLQFCVTGLPEKNSLQSLLDRLEKHKNAIDAFDSDGIGASALGPLWNGIDTNWQQVQNILTWIRELKAASPSSTMRWFGNEYSNLPTVTAYFTSLNSWGAWHERSFGCAPEVSLDSQCATATNTKKRISCLVNALDSLGAQDAVTPLEALEVIECEVKIRHSLEKLSPFSPLLNGRDWSQVEINGISQAQQWVEAIDTLQFKSHCRIDFLEADARKFLEECSETISRIEPSHIQLAARLRIQEDQPINKLLPKLEAIRTGLISVQPTLSMLHTQANATFGTVVNALQHAQKIREINTLLAPWTQVLGQALNTDDLESIQVSTAWTKAVRANHLPKSVIQWIVSSEPDHRAAWWRRLAISANIVKTSINSARNAGMLNIADATSDRFIMDWHNELPKQLAEWRGSLDLLSSSVVTSVLSLDDLARGLESHAQAASLAKQLAAFDIRLGFSAAQLTIADIKAHWSIATIARKLPPRLGHWIIDHASRDTLEKISQLSNHISDEQKARESHEALTLSFGANAPTGPQNCFDSSQSVTFRQQSIAQLLLSEGSLLPYAELLRTEKILMTNGLGELLDILYSHRPNSDNSVTIFQSVVSYHIADLTIKSNPALANFTGSRHNAERDKFSAKDLTNLTLNRSRILSAVASHDVTHGQSGRATSSLTENALLKREREKQRRHYPIRKLVERAGRAMQDLCPCWLMTPLAVAQFLTPGQIEFDLVVMDEASQLTPEDAFGAIARGQEVVIVGDPAQMPPSNFFQSTASNDDEDDEETEAATAESILELAKSSLPEATLKWHYRSKHQELIAPANAFSYYGQLILFPSATDHSNQLGIKYHYISNGCFQNQINMPEAVAVVEYLKAHLHSIAKIANGSRPSIGVLTMNQRHQEAVSTLLDQARQSDSILAKVIMEEESRQSEPLIVRNLENFQGDQRDIIVISCTYGPDIQGSDKVHQRFSSINGIAGKRRFNVAITRSKEQMVVFTSIRSDQVKVGEDKNKGVTDFYRFLRFCESDRRSGVPDLGVHTGKTMDSPFEEAVAAFLRSEGFEVEPQIGVCGYFVDLGIRHPTDRGRFALGIECDGATYHSSRAARDRDHLREGILNERGWNLYRIWSTDWFYAQVKSKEMLLRAVRQACS